MESESLRVGELARRTGLTVRALHHYDEIGVLKPSLHSGSGYRLYTATDVARLQQVLSLRQIGFSLDEIRECLNGSRFAPLEVIQLHLARVREQIDMQTRLCERLEAIAARFRSAEAVSADEFILAIEAIKMTEQYFTPEQQELIKTRREEAGEEVLRQKQEEWAELIAAVRVAMEAGVDPREAEVQSLARQWLGKVREFTGDDPAMGQAVKRLWDEQGDALAEQHGAQYDPRPVFAYMAKAIEALSAP